MAKRVVRYLKDTIDIGLIFSQETANCLSKEPPPFGLVGYANNNFAGGLEDQRLVMGYYFFLNRAIVLWTSKKQKIISILTTELEYIALRYVVQEVVWIR